MYSDGSSSPIELIDLAIQIGLSGLAITDHDTIDAYESAVDYAKKKQFLLGTGVEFSCQYKKSSIHILGYDFSLRDQGIRDYCTRQQMKRRHRNLEILDKLRRLQIIIEESELLALHDKASTLGRPHIATLMMQKGYVKSIQEAFSYYLGDNKCCYVPGEPFPVEEALGIIHAAGGKAFVAHPHLFSDATVVREILHFPFDGLECHYARCPAHKEKRWFKMVREKNLLYSGGSDFHGTVKPHIPLGCSWVNESAFYSIFQKNLITY